MDNNSRPSSEFERVYMIDIQITNKIVTKNIADDFQSMIWLVFLFLDNSKYMVLFLNS